MAADGLVGEWGWLFACTGTTSASRLSGGAIGAMLPRGNVGEDVAELNSDVGVGVAGGAAPMAT